MKSVVECCRVRVITIRARFTRTGWWRGSGRHRLRTYRSLDMRAGVPR